MKYTTEVDIDRSRTQVIEKFEDVDNFHRWQPGFVSMEHLSGTPGAAGAKSKLHYKMGKREVEMVETVIENKLPEHLFQSFEAKNVFNVQHNYFEELPGGGTRWRSESEFKFGGFMKIIGFLMPGAFKKQTKKFMVDFKAFAEESDN